MSKIDVAMLAIRGTLITGGWKDTDKNLLRDQGNLILACLKLAKSLADDGAIYCHKIEAFADVECLICLAEGPETEPFPHTDNCAYASLLALLEGNDA